MSRKKTKVIAPPHPSDELTQDELSHALYIEAGDELPKLAPIPGNVVDVHAYWKFRFGVYPSDGSLRELPLQSGCGVPCVACIDAAALLVAHMRSAGNADQIEAVEDACLRTVEIYWRG